MNVIHLNKKEKEVVFTLQTIEDLWVLKSIIEVGDIIKGTSFRRSKIDETGDSKRIPIFVSINIEKFDYSSSSDSLRFTGKIIESRPEEVAPIGDYHTLEISLGEKYTLLKKNLYDHEIDLIKTSKTITNKIFLIIIDDEKADTFVLSDIGIKEIATISSGKHGKRYSDNFDYTPFFEKIFELIKETEYQIIIAGPGHVKILFSNYIKNKNNKIKTLEIQISNTSRTAIIELFSKKEVSKFFENSIIYKEQEMLDTFKEYLGKDNGKAIYGLKKIQDAIGTGAIDYLLISEKLWKDNLDKIQLLIKAAENIKTKVHIVDNEHQTTEALRSFGGIIGVLRYKLEY